MAHKFLRLGCFNTVDVQIKKKKTVSTKIIISRNDNDKKCVGFNRKCNQMTQF